MTEAPLKRSLKEWITLIRDQEMPIFGHTVQEIISVAEDDDAPAAKLAAVVLKDASMTTRVLKLVNSIYYNPQRIPMSTISRAVVVLGFNTVRNMCLSISLVDAFVHGGARDRLTKELARAIHAAVQARSIAIDRGDDSPEEVFIAALLYHIGDMAFWCFSGDMGADLDNMLQAPGYTKEQAEEELLGFQLKNLSTGLANEWSLNPLLLDTLTNPDDENPRLRSVSIAHDIAAVAEKYGWESEEAQELLKELEEITGSSPKNVADMVHNNAHEAAEIATFYGAANAAQAIPLPRGSEAPRAQEEVPDIEYPEPDGMLQLKILREISSLLENGCNLNMMMEMAMEGIYRGVGMDRVVFAMITPDRKGLRAKFALGHGNQKLLNSFNFARLPGSRHIFFEAVDKECSLLADVDKTPGLAPMITNNITSVIGKRPFLLSTVAIKGKGIGILFADRALSGRAIDEESTESFKHFAKQANMGLTLLATRR